MLKATIVTTYEELMQIQQLNTANYRANLPPEEKDKEGFVSWPLMKMKMYTRLSLIKPIQTASF